MKLIYITILIPFLSFGMSSDQMVQKAIADKDTDALHLLMNQHYRIQSYIFWLGQAAQNYFMDGIKILIHAGAQDKAFFRNIKSPLDDALDKAIDQEHYDDISYLLEQGAKLNMPVNQSSCQRCHPCLYKQFAYCHKQRNYLVRAIERKSGKLLEFLIGKGLDVQRYCNNQSALSYAHANGNEEVFRILVRAGAKLHIRDEHILDHYQKIDIELAEQLFKSMDCNAQDKLGRSDLHWAIVNQDIEGLRKLLKVPGIRLDLMDCNYAVAEDLAKSMPLKKYMLKLFKNECELWMLEIDMEIFPMKRILKRALLQSNVCLIESLLSKPIFEPLLKDAYFTVRQLYNATHNPFLKKDFKFIGRLIMQYLQYYDSQGAVSKRGLIPQSLLPAEVFDNVHRMAFNRKGEFTKIYKAT